MTVRARLVAARVAALLLASVCAGAASAGERAPLTFEQRVLCLRKVEQVYWNHRVWPKENPGPKPALSAVLPDEALRAKVEAQLKASSLLADYWKQPPTGARLQAEIDRMARDTKSPETLRELFAALNDDPRLIAECLARPALERRDVESSYWSDTRIHGERKARIEAEVASLRGDASALSSLSGAYSETTLALDDEATSRKGVRSEATADEPGTRRLDRAEFAAVVDRLRGLFGVGTDADAALRPRRTTAFAAATEAAADADREIAARVAALPRLRLSAVEDEGANFAVRVVLAADGASVKVGTAIWPKRAYADWAAERPNGVAPEIGEPSGGYKATAPKVGGCTDDTWQPTARGSMPQAGAVKTAVWTGAEMIVWGGTDPIGQASNAGGRYNPTTDSWVPCSLPAGGGGAPSARLFHSAVWTGSEMIVWGGMNGSGAALNTGGRYNPETDSWAASSLTTAAGANVPSPRREHTAVWTGAEMIVWGGTSDGRAGLGDGGRYSPTTDSWASSSGLAAGASAPAGRFDHTAVWTGTEMIVWGGAGPSGTYLNTGGRYDPTTDGWATSALASGAGSGVPSARSRHTAVWTGAEMIVWGGCANEDAPPSTGGRYNPATDSWAASSLTTGAGANVPVGRVHHTAVWTGSEMIVWGGSDGTSYGYEGGGRYNPATDSWAASSLTTGSGANVPSARLYHTAVWTGGEMLVWGGMRQGGMVATGGRYNPATDSWAAGALSLAAGGGAPSGRQLHTAVWTGAEMIVWGGEDFEHSNGLNTGGRYDPAADAWTASSLPTAAGPNVPGPRVYHTAVWTGREMIVWGGKTGSTRLGTGGRYNPATDAWATCSLTAGSGSNVPPPRGYHTAVWTGSEMIVWGGSTAGAPSGGRYNPDTDTWAASSLTTGAGADVPQARTGQTAVWTGRELIVWGGSSSDAPGTGGRYNPRTDTWAACSLTTGAGANVPLGRSDQTAVWTGREMIVWGGYATHETNTGGRYNPDTDTWAATTTGDRVPAARHDAAGVWTGAEMIVFGGSAQSAVFKTGGRYDPTTDAWAASSLTDGSGSDVPSPRFVVSAVWTGAADHRMIVWGGTDMGGMYDTGGLYCAAVPSCASQIMHRDADGDGRGDPATAATACVAPAGWVSSGDDCDDADAAVWSVPGEVASLLVGADKTTLRWSATPWSGGAAPATYRVFRQSGALSSGTLWGNVASGLAELSTTDATVPAAGAASYYLVGAFNGCGGTLGAGSDGTARTGATP